MIDLSGHFSLNNYSFLNKDALKAQCHRRVTKLPRGSQTFDKPQSIS